MVTLFSICAIFTAAAAILAPASVAAQPSENELPEPGHGSDPSHYFYQQPNDGEYWWIINNTRRWLSRSCAQTHLNAGKSPQLIQYSVLQHIPRDDGPCPPVQVVEPQPEPPENELPEPGQGSDPSHYFYQQPNDGAYWWIINNTRRWLSSSCAQTHRNAGNFPRIIEYSVLRDIPQESGPCPPVQVVEPQPEPPEDELPEPGQGSDPSHYFYQQPNDGEYWWIINNTRRWLSRSCAQTHRNAGNFPRIIEYSVLRDIPQEHGPCPAILQPPLPPAPEPTTPVPTHPVAPDLSALDNPAGLFNFYDYENTPANELDAFGGGRYGPFLHDDFTSVVDRSSNGNSPQGQFRIICTPSHFAYDDPIIFPGQPGRAHMHMFWGNTLADAYSNTQSGNEHSLLDSGSSTCQGGALNRSAYWMPAMLSGSAGPGRKVVMPKVITLYYKSHRPWEAQVLPQGVQLLGGNFDRNGQLLQAFTPGYNLHWGCYNSARGMAENLSGTIPGTNGTPACPAGWDIQATIQFPQCLAVFNGQPVLQHPDFISHTALINNTAACPSSHPYRVPQISYLVRWANPEGNAEASWRLSSDLEFEKPAGQVPFPGGSLHGDWIGAWHDGAIQAWMDGCFRTSNAPEQPGRNCSLGQTGENGTSRAFKRFYGSGINGGLMEYSVGPQMLDDPVPEYIGQMQH